jgi:hypothetical protein
VKELKKLEIDAKENYENSLNSDTVKALAE